MININNYKEVIRTSNGDGTEKVEIIGCKMINNGEEVECNLILPRVSEVDSTAFADCSIDSMEDNLTFTLYIPD